MAKLDTSDSHFRDLQPNSNDLVYETPTKRHPHARAKAPSPRAKRATAAKRTRTRTKNHRPYHQPLTKAKKPPATENVMGLIGFILSMFALVANYFLGVAGALLVVVLWLPGLISSLVGLRQAPRGFAVAGIVLSCIWLVLFVVGLVIYQHEQTLAQEAMSEFNGSFAVF